MYLFRANPDKKQQQILARARVNRARAEQLAQQATRQEESAVRKCEEAIATQRHDRAKLYAQQAVRNRVTALRYDNLSMQLETFEQRIAEGNITSHMGQTMTQAVQMMSTTMSPLRAAQQVETMQAFETQMESMISMQNGVQGAMDASAQTVETDVDNLLQHLKDGHTLDTIHQLPLTIESMNAAAVTDLEGRIRELRS